MAPFAPANSPLRAYYFIRFIYSFVYGIPLGASAEETVCSKSHISIGGEPTECKICGTPSTSGGIAPSFSW